MILKYLFKFTICKILAVFYKLLGLVESEQQFDRIHFITIYLILLES